MKYCVLGAGLMGRAAAYDLLAQKDTTLVLLCDSNQNQLDEAKKLLNDERLHTKVFDANNQTQVENLLRNIDCAIAAVHYGFNLQFTKAAIKTRTHFCDLGGNNTIVDAQLKLDSEAKKAGISIIPDCGLAPGMVAVLVKWGIEKFNWVDTVKIRVGGLPQKPSNNLNYERLFSIDGLINEYVEPVRVLRNGEIKIIEPLTEIEEIEFPPPYGKLEAFTTSGGTSTLVETYKERLKNLDYKTIRYKGHCNEIKKVQKSNQFTYEYFKKNLPLCKSDVTLVKIIFEGNSKKHELTIIDYATKNPPFTSMMRMTAFSASIIAQMQTRKEINIYGVCPQEKCVSPDILIKELKKRNIVINGL